MYNATGSSCGWVRAIFEATRSERASESWLDCCCCWLAGGELRRRTAHHPSLSQSSLQPELVAGWPSPSGTSRHPFHPHHYSPTCTTTPGASTGIDHGFQKHMYSLPAYSGSACCPPYRPTCSTPPGFRIFRLETILETSSHPPVCPTESCTRCRLATPARK
jgi:hypothetical protein